MSSRASSSGSAPSISVIGLLGVAFVVLKLTGHITWSWWWVTAPFWGGFALGATWFVGAFVWAVASLAVRKEDP